MNEVVAESDEESNQNQNGSHQRQTECHRVERLRIVNIIFVCLVKATAAAERASAGADNQQPKGHQQQHSVATIAIPWLRFQNWLIIKILGPEMYSYAHT